MHCTYSIEEAKELSLSLYSDSMGVNIGKRLSLYSDNHGGGNMKVFPMFKPDKLNKTPYDSSFDASLWKYEMDVS